MPAKIIDQEARDMARNAMGLIQSHEAACAERWSATEKTMGLILRVLAWGTAGLIGTMGSLIAWLVTHQPVPV